MKTLILIISFLVFGCGAGGQGGSNTTSQNAEASSTPTTTQTNAARHDPTYQDSISAPDYPAFHQQLMSGISSIDASAASSGSSGPAIKQMAVLINGLAQSDSRYYQFRLEDGITAIEQSGTARGSGLTNEQIRNEVLANL